MKNFKSKIQLLSCLSLLLALVNCDNIKIKQGEKPYTARVYTGKTFMDSGFSEIECDSFNMESSFKATIFVDGRKSVIITDGVISIRSN